MSTPSLQTFITDASQVLNLSSISAVRSVVAVALANANAGTPLNPNLTTQQLWNEFYQVVTEPKSNIESFIANQMMKFFFAPPAPGGVGSDKQVIFNDMGVLAGDAGLVYNKTTDALTVAGLVTAGSATITGAATVGTTLGVTGVSTLSGNTLNVGGGNSSPVVNFKAADTGSVTLNFGGTTNPDKGRILYSDNSDILSIYTADTERIRVESAGDVKIVTGNVVMATSGKGIDFSAVTGGTGTATGNVLNDYEEGTFLPTVIGTTIAGTVSYGRQLGRYTKVGNLVTVQIYLSWSLGIGGTGNLAFGGLPFTIANNANEYATGTIGVIDGIALTALYVPSISGSWNTTILNLNQFPVGGGTNAGVPWDAAGAILFTSTYIA
jgi:hypothetical protein